LGRFGDECAGTFDVAVFRHRDHTRFKVRAFLFDDVFDEELADFPSLIRFLSDCAPLLVAARGE
jgi:hypothetical protein